ncbi:CinA family protein [Teredinibacter waterburyi]|uniref:CinA family protein n=1 Tax=Teredinibacter waterburyi TaxID=1500538 RepID=UPI00165ED6AD|nr:CinA family protein [Teredinibacter waterburyi]
MPTLHTEKTSTLLDLASELGERLARRHQHLALAESCTGGAIAAAVTAVSGSSGWFDLGVVAYSNIIKQQVLAVPPHLLEEYGAVSEPVVAAMATGVAQLASADWGIATSGIAGPCGGTDEKPVGTVCFAWALPLVLSQVSGVSVLTERHCFTGDRAAVQYQSVHYALSKLLCLLDKNTV